MYIDSKGDRDPDFFLTAILPNEEYGVVAKVDRSQLHNDTKVEVFYLCYALETVAKTTGLITIAAIPLAWEII